MKLIAQFSRSKVLAGSGHNLDLMVRLRAPAPVQTAARSSVGIIPVVDVSGSMAGAKLEAVRHALGRLLDHLVPGDHAALVSFDSDVHRLSPLVEITERKRADLRHLVKGLREGSSTNLAGGLVEGLRVARENAPTGLRTRVVLLTDGQANHGAATTPESLVALVREQAQGVAVSAFGLGDDCDQALLAAMADVRGGSYAYLQNEDVVMSAFARELGGLISTYASGVHVRMTPLAGAPIEETLADLLYQGELVVCVPIAAPVHGRARDVELCQIEATWRDGAGREQKANTVARIDYVPAGEEDKLDAPEVSRLRDERILARAQEAAEEKARGGDFEAARKKISGALRKMRDPALLAFARDSLLPLYANPEEYTGSSSMRGSTLSALKGKRQVSAHATVAAMFDVGPSASEAAMEKSFKDGKK